MPKIRLADLDITFDEKNNRLEIAEEMFKQITTRFQNWPKELFAPLIEKILTNIPVEARDIKFLVKGSKFGSDKQVVGVIGEGYRRKRERVVSIDTNNMLHLAVLVNDVTFLNALLAEPNSHGVDERIDYLLKKDNCSLLSVAVQLCNHEVILRIIDLYNEWYLLPQALKADGQHHALSAAIHRCAHDYAKVARAHKASTEQSPDDDLEVACHESREVFRMVAGAYHVAVPVGALRARGFELFQVALRTQNLDLLREVVALYAQFNMVEEALVAPDRLQPTALSVGYKSSKLSSVSYQENKPVLETVQQYWALGYAVAECNACLVRFLLDECLGHEVRSAALTFDNFSVMRRLYNKDIFGGARANVVELTSLLLEHYDRYEDLSVDLVCSNNFGLIYFAVKLADLSILEKVIIKYNSIESHEYKSAKYKSLMHEVLVRDQFCLMTSAISSGDFKLVNTVQSLYEYVLVADKKTAFQLALAAHETNTKIPLLVYTVITNYKNADVLNKVFSHYNREDIIGILPKVSQTLTNGDVTAPLDLKWALIRIIVDQNLVELPCYAMMLRHCVLESFHSYNLIAQLEKQLEYLQLTELPDSVLNYQVQAKDQFEQPYKILSNAAKYACVEIWEWVLAQYNRDAHEEVSQNLNLALFGDAQNVGLKVLGFIFERDVAQIDPMMSMLLKRVTSNTNVARMLIKVKQPVISDKREWRYELLKNVLLKSSQDYARIATVLCIYRKMDALTSVAVAQLNEIVDIVAFLTFCNRNSYGELLTDLLSTRIARYGSDLAFSPKSYLMTLVGDKLERGLAFRLESAVKEAILDRPRLFDDADYKCFVQKCLAVLSSEYPSGISEAAALDFIGCYDDYTETDPSSENMPAVLMRMEHMMRSIQSEEQLQILANQSQSMQHFDDPQLQPFAAVLRCHFAIDLKYLAYQYAQIWPLDQLILNSQRIINCVEQLQKHANLTGFHSYTLFDLAILTGDVRFVRNILELPHVEWLWDGDGVVDGKINGLVLERALILAIYTNNVEMLELLKKHLSHPIDNENLLFQLAARNANLTTFNYVFNVIGGLSKRELLRNQRYISLRIVIKNHNVDVIEHIIDLYNSQGLMREALKAGTYKLLMEAIAYGDILILQRVIQVYRSSGLLNEALKTLDKTAIYAAIKSGNLAIYDCIADLYSGLKLLKTLLLADNLESLVISAEIGDDDIYDKIFKNVDRHLQSLIIRDDLLLRLLSTKVPHYICKVINLFSPRDIKKIFLQAVYPNDKPNIAPLLAAIKLADVTVFDWLVALFHTHGVIKKTHFLSSSEYDLLSEFLKDEDVLTTAFQTRNLEVFNKIRSMIHNTMPASSATENSLIKEEVMQKQIEKYWHFILAALKSGDLSILSETADIEVRKAYFTFSADYFEQALVAAISGGNEEIVSEVVSSYEQQNSAAMKAMHMNSVVVSAFAQDNIAIINLVLNVLDKVFVSDVLYDLLPTDENDIDKFLYCSKIAFILKHGSEEVVDKFYNEYYHTAQLHVSPKTLLRFLVLEGNGEHVESALRLFTDSQPASQNCKEISDRLQMTSRLQRIISTMSQTTAQPRPASSYLEEIEEPVGQATIIDLNTAVSPAVDITPSATSAAKASSSGHNDSKPLASNLLSNSVFANHDAASADDPTAANGGGAKRETHV